MIAVDTNLLIYAHRRDSPWHEVAAKTIRDLAQSGTRWAIPWPCIHEFLAITTHPRIYDPPSEPSEAMDQVEAWLESPSLTLLAEGPRYSNQLFRTLGSSKVVGPRIHDARVAALCMYHGVRELWTADRDFSRFGELKVRNPLVG